MAGIPTAQNKMSDEAKTPVKWSAQYKLPTDSNYVNRVTDITFGPSKSSGNPMVTLSCEIVDPKEVEVGEELVNINGIQTTNYFTATVMKEEDGKKVVDEEKTANARKRFREFWASCELDVEQINWDNVDTKPLQGLILMTAMTSEEEIRRKTPTSAQITEAKTKNKRVEGDVMKHPVTGKPLTNYWPKITDFFGAAPDQAAYGGKSAS